MKQEIKERIELINKGIVPAGYKKTSVGICPVEWEENTLKNIFIFKNGLNKEKSAFGKGTPIINYTDVWGKRGLKLKDVKGKVTLNKNEIENYSAKKGDVFFTRTSETINEIGLTSVLLEDIKDCVFSGFVLRGRPISNLIVNEYNQYCYSLDFMRNEITKKSSYTTRALTNGELLSQVLINLPTKSEQQKIAEILDCATRQVELQEQLVDKLKVQKKALMQKLLTPQPDWQEVKLGDVVTYASSGGTPKTDFEEYYNGNIVWVSIDDITKCQKYIENSSRKITDLGLKNSSTKLLNPNTILFAMYASIGKCAISKVLCTTSQAILGLVANEKKVGYEYLYYTLCFMEDSLKLLGQKGSQSNLNKQMVLNFNVFLPNLKEQNEITNILKNIDKQIELQQKLLEQYKLRKKALMQLLLTGIVRVCK